MRDFPSHVLRKNHARGIPTRVVYLDTETRPDVWQGLNVQVMRLGWTCAVRYDAQGYPEREQWQEWHDGKAMWEYIAGLTHSHTSVHLFAHNAFFDLQASGFFRYFAEWGWCTAFYHDKGLTYILLVTRDNAALKILSSTNFYECSLREMGNLVGLPKKEVDFGSVNETRLSEYCHRDVEILRLGMERYFHFLLDHDLGRFRLSKASQAMAAYRHRFMQHKIYFHQDEKVRKLEREAYFGGRVECFELGRIQGGPFLYLDVNSMYPYVMRETAVPCRLVDYRESIALEEINDVLDRFCVIARCSLDTDLPLYPVRQNGKVVYPVGRFSGVLGTSGILEAVKRRHLSHVGETAVYEKAVIFREYVDTLHALKEKYTRENRPVDRYLVKKLLNSLYGKWAQKRPVIEEIEDLDACDYWREEVYDMVTGQTEVEYQFLNQRVRLFGEEDTEQTFTAISAHITEAARIHLWRLIEPFWPDRILYCDTDSLMIRASDLGLLAAEISDTKLGALKIEGKFDTLHIYGPKAYETERKRVLKGIPKGAKQVGKVRYIYDAFPKQATHQRTRLDTGVIVRRVTKVLRGRYDKGIVLPTGRVIPFHFESADLPA